MENSNLHELKTSNPYIEKKKTLPEQIITVSNFVKLDVERD